MFQFAGKKGGDRSPRSPTAGVPLTLLAQRNQGSVHLEIRYLVESAERARQHLAWSKTGVSENITWGYSIYSSVHQTTPFGTAVQNGATGACPALEERRGGVEPRRGRGRRLRRQRLGDAHEQLRPRAPASRQRWRQCEVAHAGRLLGRAGLGVDDHELDPRRGTGTFDWALIGAPLKPI